MSKELASIAFRRLNKVFLPQDKAYMPAKLTDVKLQLAFFGYELTNSALELMKSTKLVNVENVYALLFERLTPSMQKSVFKKIAEAQEFSSTMGATYEELLATGTLVKLDGSSGVEFEEVFERLVAQPLPYSPQDLDDISALADIYPIGDNLQASSRENNATLAGLFAEYNWTRGATVTDVLRVASVWSGGTPDLAENVKFKLSRVQRRALISVLERNLRGNVRASFDIARYPEKWKRLLKALHPSDYKWAKATQACSKEVYCDHTVSEDARIEAAIKIANAPVLLERLSENPGVFARRLAELLRKFPEDRDDIIESFDKVSSQVSSKVLVQARNHFSGPDRHKRDRLPVRFKSRTVRDGWLANRLDGNYFDVLDAIDKGLSSKLAGKKVFFEEIIAGQAKGIKLMTSNRSVNKGGLTVAPGSRIKTPVTDYLSLFMHWKDIEDHRVDLDLSARFLSSDLRDSEDIAYYNTIGVARHSGDITAAPQGAEEYINISLAKVKESAYRYILMNVCSYTGQNVSEVPEAYAGFVGVESLESSFNASDVWARFDLMSEGREVTPLIYDVETNEIIWVDMQFAGLKRSSNLMNSNNVGGILENLLANNHVSVYDFVALSGATIVTNKEDADLIIDPLQVDQVAQLLN